MGLGWIIDRSMIAGKTAKLDYQNDPQEQLEDERELVLIRNVTIGDSIDRHTDLLMLADTVFTRGEPDFANVYDYIARKSPTMPPSSECQIWTFDLFNLEMEGTKQYLLLVHKGRIVNVCPGLSVTL
jgi:hypothetical protein